MIKYFVIISNFLHFIRISVVNGDTFACLGKYKNCDIQAWDPWSSCNTKCGVGQQNRNRPVCCDPSKIKPFNLVNCLSYCKIDIWSYQQNDMERRNCGACFNGTYDKVQNRCQCFKGYGGTCCNKGELKYSKLFKVIIYPFIEKHIYFLQRILT